jgi:hypothetical protein
MGPVPPNWMTYFQVADIAASVNQAVDLGGKIVVPITPIPDVGRFAVLTDAQGAHFGVMQSEPQA